METKFKVGDILGGGYRTPDFDKNFIGFQVIELISKKYKSNPYNYVGYLLSNGRDFCIDSGIEVETWPIRSKVGKLLYA